MFRRSLELSFPSNIFLQMSDVLNELKVKEDGLQYTGLTKLISAKKKAEAIMNRSQKTASSVESSLAGERHSIMSQRRHITLLEARYTAECKASGLTPQRSILRMCELEDSSADFGSSLLGAFGALPLMRALVGASHIQRLCLASCGIDDDAVGLLSTALYTMPILWELDISKNISIGFVGGFVIQRFAFDSTSIRRIDLRGTTVRASTARSIAKRCEVNANGLADM